MTSAMAEAWLDASRDERCAWDRGGITLFTMRQFSAGSPQSRWALFSRLTRGYSSGVTGVLACARSAYVREPGDEPRRSFSGRENISTTQHEIAVVTVSRFILWLLDRRSSDHAYPRNACQGPGKDSFRMWTHRLMMVGCCHGPHAWVWAWRTR